MADREFVGKVWVDFLVNQEIPFFIRVKERTDSLNGAKSIVTLASSFVI